ncbi:hypothetical protein ABW20_dc0101635 [Dactylellina cionopaga]|nr:hypothetical protein ABW20_dc0101635 [Dactylellina cionopaga]
MRQDKFELVSRCGYRRHCGHKHRQFAVAELNERTPSFRYWRNFGQTNKNLTPRELGRWLCEALGFFLDGDQNVRLQVVQTLSTGRPLDQLKLCLSSQFLSQRWSPQVNFQDHVLPILRIMSDPILRSDHEALSHAFNIYQVVLDTSHRIFWRQVVKMTDEFIQMFPHRIGPQMVGILNIFINWVAFDLKNVDSPIIRDSIPKIKLQLEAVKDQECGGQISPVLLRLFQQLESMVSQKHPTAQNTALQPSKPHARPAADPIFEDIPGQMRAFQLSQQFEMVGYLQRIDVQIIRDQTVRGSLVSGNEATHLKIKKQQHIENEELQQV